MNWKFDFSPETSAVVHVSDLLECGRNLGSPLHLGQAIAKRLTHDGRYAL